MKKICICAHFGFGKNLLNGQTIKASILLNALEHHLGKYEIKTVDTHGGAKNIPSMCVETLKGFFSCDNVVILPANNGLRLFVPLCSLLNVFFHRRLFYIVVGGWLPDFVDNHLIIATLLRRFSRIFVETHEMHNTLVAKGYKNISVLPNCKTLPILHDNQIQYENEPPYKLCTFSRVMKEKGIEIAIDAVREVNKKMGKVVFQLDIYGQVSKSYIDDFENIMATAPEYIRYRGAIPYNQSVMVLQNYTALMFPTFYDGEGFAGTLIDAMAAGIPVVASDWKYNKEIVDDYETGVLIRNCNSSNVRDCLLWMYENIHQWNLMKLKCIRKALKYDANNVYQTFIDYLK